MLDILGRNEPEQFVGQDTFDITLNPVRKQLRRCTLSNEEQTIQVMVVWGVFVSNRAQTWLENRRLFAGFITVYVRGSVIPQWQRFWGVLSATQLALFDFEYKETRPVVHVVPLRKLTSAFHPSMADDERQVDVGPLGLALQFSEAGKDAPCSNFECRMYVLPDSSETAQYWMEALTYGISLLREFHHSGLDSGIPLKLLW
ncbi:hypothetical protein EC973_006714 [Apophysomyces ossiformis]|uniref:PH domain-containing protein n=1 Tax=Apophysomyces ossiformis TaxID=679940 RepID=A0A8H7ES61_9FUNG|nr:hypothetical protein EC973_006714 [Apophysomyces ossiformis]